MQIGEKYSRQQLKELGWKKEADAKGFAEIWTKDTHYGGYQTKVVWRVKTQAIYLMWDKPKT